MDRLQKVIAHSGVASRRVAEELIKQGVVSVNGKVITEMGYLVSSSDTITVKGEVIGKVDTYYYLALNKPSGYICSTADEKRRKTIMDLLPDKYQNIRLYPVGRLDYDTKGVILITNDGAFMNEMVGPQSGVEKEYLARIEGLVTNEDLYIFYQGITIDGVKYLPARFKIESVDQKHSSSLVRLLITEGRNHQVKKMFEAIGHPVKKLTRVRFGCITLDGLNVGDVRPLTIHEIKLLHQAANLNKNIRKRD